MQMLSSDASLKLTGYILTLVVITIFNWLNDVADLRHHATASSTSSDKKAYYFHLFDSF